MGVSRCELPIGIPRICIFETSSANLVSHQLTWNDTIGALAFDWKGFYCVWNKSVSLKKRAWSRKPLVPIKQTKNKHCHISTQGPVGCRAEVESGSTTPEHQMVLRECVVRRQRKTGGKATPAAAGSSPRKVGRHGWQTALNLVRTIKALHTWG